MSNNIFYTECKMTGRLFYWNKIHNSRWCPISIPKNGGHFEIFIATYYFEKPGGLYGDKNINRKGFPSSMCRQQSMKNVSLHIH